MGSLHPASASCLCILPSPFQSPQPPWLLQMPVLWPGQSPGKVRSTPGTLLPPCRSWPTCPAAPLVGATHSPTLPQVPEPLGELSCLPCSPMASQALLCSAPQDTASGPSSPSTATARHGCGAGAAAHPCSSSAARHGPACASTTWTLTPAGPRWKVRVPQTVRR